MHYFIIIMYLRIVFRSLTFSLYGFVMAFILMSFDGSAMLPTQNPSLRFIENKGQWAPNILFRADIPGGTMFLEKQAITYVFIDGQSTFLHQHGHRAKTAKAHAMRLYFDHSQMPDQISASQAFETYYNYFIGSDSKYWASHVNAYQTVRYQNLYPGIDLILTCTANGIKSSFSVQAGVDYHQISMRYEGADAMQVYADSVHIETSISSIDEIAPMSMQGDHILHTSFISNKNSYGFHVPEADKSKALLIDPQLIFGTFVGSPADNFGFTSTYEKGGNAYAAGTVYAANFPVTLGAYDVTFNGGNDAGNQYARDVIISKFNSGGTNMLFATYLGGTDNEQPISMIVNHAGNLLVYGSTSSADFPHTFGVISDSMKGSGDVFIAKFNASGTSLLQSSFLGGDGLDGISGDDTWPYTSNQSKLNYNYADWYRGNIEVDALDNIYLIGTTQSISGFPLTNAFQNTLNGNQDAFIAVLNSNISSIQFCSYFGGNKDDAGYSLTIDKSGNLYIAGGTESTNLPYSINGYSGDIDGYVAFISGDFSQVKSRYIGTPFYDQTFFVTCDLNNEVLICGQSAGNMPMTANVASNPGSHQYISVLNAALTSILRSTNFGSKTTNPQLSISSFTVDVCKRIYLTGWGGAVDNEYNAGNDYMNGMPLTSDAFQKTTDGSDFYILVYSIDLKKIYYASYYGGRVSEEHVDGGTSHLDANFIIYQTICAGCGGYSDMPTSIDAYSRINKGRRAFNLNYGGCNIALIKFDLNTYKKPPKFNDTTIVVNPGDTLAFQLRMFDENQNLVTFNPSGSLLTDASITPAIYNIDQQSGITTAEFNWPVTCADVRSDTFYLNLNMVDDACPEPQSGIGKLKIVVKENPPAEPVPACLQHINEHSVSIQWNSAQQNKLFKGYSILRKAPNGIYTEYKNIKNGEPNSFMDTSASGHISIPFCYKLYAYDICNMHSDTSRDICSVSNLDPNHEIFMHSADTLLSCFRSDTILFSDTISSIFKSDSVFIDSIYGNLLTYSNFQFKHTDHKGRSIIQMNFISDCSTPMIDTLHLYVRYNDNHCPQNNNTLQHIRIVVLPPIAEARTGMDCPEILDDAHIRLHVAGLNQTRYIKEIQVLAGANQHPKTIIKTLATQTEDTISWIIDVPNTYNQNICFQFVPIDICGYALDSTIEVCTQNNRGNEIAALNMFHVSVNPEQHIEVNWYKSTDSSRFNDYRIFRRSSHEGLFKQIEKLSGRSDTIFIDKEAKTNELSYCYVVAAADKCGIISTNNDTSCSILLNGLSEPFVHFTTWNPYIGWRNGISYYNVFKTEPTLYEDSLIATNSTKIIKYNDRKLNWENGLYEYYIQAKENKGNLAWSNSNRIQLVQSPIVRVPNAYTPNGDNINDLWRSVPVFVKDFNLQLFNRWGEKLWETNDKHAFYSSTFDGLSQDPQSLMSGVIFYIISYSGWDGTYNTISGNITILK